MSTIKVPATGTVEQRLGHLEQANNYSEVVLPFTVIGDTETGSGGTGGPPTGPAGGALTGSYPNPGLADNVVTSAKIVDGTIQAVDIASGVIPTALPPNGPAGGDLTGTYPNPTIGAAKVTRAKTAADCWLSPVPVDPANVGQVLGVAAGPTLVWQTVSAEGISGHWNWKGALGVVDPGARNMGSDTTPATVVVFSRTTADNTDATNALVTTAPGDVLVVQQRTDASKWARYEVTAAVTNNTTWFAVPVTRLAVGTGGLPTVNADVTVQFQRSTGVVGPSGPAGGDLTGTYPNPTIAAGAVGNAEISDVAYAKVTGAPTSLPPSGTAGGSLAGSYPNPTIAASGVTAGTYGSAAKVASVTVNAEGRVTGVTEVDIAPTGGSPSGPAGGDLSGTYPNPRVVRACWG